MSRRLPLGLISSLALLAGIGASRGAHADVLNGFAADRLEPSERGSQWFSQDDLDMRGELRPAIGVTGSWSYLTQRLHANDGTHVALIEDSFAAHVGASLALFDRVRLGVSLPVFLAQSGTNVTYGGVAYKAPSGASIGDLRIGLDVRLFGDVGDAFRLGVGARVWAPTGDVSQFTSDGKARFAPHLLAAGDLGDVTWSASLTYLARFAGGSFGSGKVGSELQLAGAIGYRLLDKKLLIGPELEIALPVDQGSSALFDDYSTIAWGVLGAHYRAGDFQFGLAAGPGFTKAEGNAAFRTLLSLEWAPLPSEAPPPPADRDHDGIVDASDACPDVAGAQSTDPKKNGCPADRDGDGIVDKDDACPDVAGVQSTDPKKNGCPSDRDNDSIIDAEDACPDVAGVKNADPKKNGCPSDRDGDGIIDAEDACPDHAGPRNADPKKNGCPAVKVNAGRIEILEQIQFKTGSAEILPVSMEIVHAVAKIMTEHAEIKKVRVEGHTDNKGFAGMNKDLSKRRAASVVTALVKAGIDKGRLVSEGFGQEKPLASNDTEEGRQTNRRVEFHIVDGPGAPVKEAKDVKPVAKPAGKDGKAKPPTK